MRQSPIQSIDKKKVLVELSATRKATYLTYPCSKTTMAPHTH